MSTRWILCEYLTGKPRKGTIRCMDIINYPSPALKQAAAEVDPKRDPDLKRLIATMAKTMYAAQGVGLAATQIGILKRVMVYDLGEELVALCNPRIVAHSAEKAVLEEGCLSVPGVDVPIERPASVTCEAEDIAGNTVTIEADELLARVLQHEIDHLDGVLILDRATAQERSAAIRRYNELKQAR